MAAIGRVTARTPAPTLVRRAAVAVRKAAPLLAARAASAVQAAATLPVTRQDVEARLQDARRVFADIDLFVAPSQSIADEFAALGLPAAKIRVSDYGFAPLPAATRQPRNGRVRFGAVGTLVWHKGLHVLLDAVRRLPSDRYELKVFGDPNTFPDYTAALRDRAAGLPVRFMGRFNRAAVSEVFSQFDVLVVPSIWMENSPLVIHEAFMTGTPVVASRIGGITGLVEHGRNGLLYDAPSADDLGQTLQTLVDEPGRIDALANGAPAVRTLEADAAQWSTTYAEVARRTPTVS
jgi:glycosyltransferase involved in cell wall biosynthesis